MSKLTSLMKVFRGVFHSDPERDWLALLSASTIVLVGIVVWNIWAFDTVAGGGTIGQANTSATPVFSQSSLDAIHSIFANRSVEQAKYVSGTYQYADPSQ